MGGNGYANITRPDPPAEEPPAEPRRIQVHEPAPRYESLAEKLFYEAPEQKRQPGESIEVWMDRVAAAATAAGFVGTKRDPAARRPAPSERPTPKQPWLPYAREPGEEG